MLVALKKLLVGNPLATHRKAHERLNNWTALAVFSSDALSSVAYATEEIFFMLILAGSGALHYSLPVAGGVVVLLIILSFSYNQTFHAYPDGGGAYRVASQNLGKYPGLLAAAALLVDYTLTVAVSSAAGIAALVSAFPVLEPEKVILTIFFISLVALINLRGVRESGFIFAIPTYLFIVSIILLLVVGLFKLAFGLLPPLEQAVASQHMVEATQSLTLFLVLRAFTSGCTALSGVEAISNGIQAFKSPEADNAGKTLRAMATILGIMFFGVTFLAFALQIIPNHQETVVSQIAARIYGRNIFYYVTQIFTMLILFLAANTSFADFPRLSALLSRDKYLPRVFMNVGDKLVYSNGIIVLAFFSSLLVILYKGSVHALIPLYAVGVFLSFALSDSGMVAFWFKHQGHGWKKSAAINLLGAITSFTVFIIMFVTKFTHGAWIVVLVVPFLMLIFNKIHGHFDELSSRLSLSNLSTYQKLTGNKVVLLVSGVHMNMIEALDYARSIVKRPEDIKAIHLAIEPEAVPALQEKWRKYASDIPLICLESPYRSLSEPLLKFLKKVGQEHPHSFLTIIIPEFVTKTWVERLLHNQTTLFLKKALNEKKYRVISSVRYYLK